MAQTYSTYEAKARFSEIIRKVRAGQRIVISHRGRDVAEIRPLGPRNQDLAHRLEHLEDEGVLDRQASPAGSLGPLARRPGALARVWTSSRWTSVNVKCPSGSGSTQWNGPRCCARQ